MGQIASSMNRREDRKLPSKTVTNPRGQPKDEGFQSEHAHAVTTLQSGRQIGDEVDDPDMPKNNSRADPMVVEDQEEEESVPSDESHNHPTPSVCIPKAPFLHAS